MRPSPTGQHCIGADAMDGKASMKAQCDVALWPVREGQGRQTRGGARRGGVGAMDVPHMSQTLHSCGKAPYVGGVKRMVAPLRPFKASVGKMEKRPF